MPSSTENPWPLLTLAGRRLIAVSSYEPVDELRDEAGLAEAEAGLPEMRREHARYVSEVFV